MTQEDIDRIGERARAAFDASVDGLDAATRSRLTQARHAALAELERPRPRLAGWLPAAALAASAVVAVGLWVQLGAPGQPPEGSGVASFVGEDLELLTAGEDLDMLDEDIEFYAWAASGAGGNGVG